MAKGKFIVAMDPTAFKKILQIFLDEELFPWSYTVYGVILKIYALLDARLNPTLH